MIRYSNEETKRDLCISILKNRNDDLQGALLSKNPDSINSVCVLLRAIAFVGPAAVQLTNRKVPLESISDLPQLIESPRTRYRTSLWIAAVIREDPQQTGRQLLLRQDIMAALLSHLASDRGHLLHEVSPFPLFHVAAASVPHARAVERAAVAAHEARALRLGGSERAALRLPAAAGERRAAALRAQPLRAGRLLPVPAAGVLFADVAPADDAVPHAGDAESLPLRLRPRALPRRAPRPPRGALPPLRPRRQRRFRRGRPRAAPLGAGTAGLRRLVQHRRLPHRAAAPAARAAIRRLRCAANRLRRRLLRADPHVALPRCALARRRRQKKALFRSCWRRASPPPRPKWC